MSSNLDPKNWTSRISQKPVEIGKDEFIQRGGLKNKDLLQVKIERVSMRKRKCKFVTGFKINIVKRCKHEGKKDGYCLKHYREYKNQNERV